MHVAVETDMEHIIALRFQDSVQRDDGLLELRLDWQVVLLDYSLATLEINLIRKNNLHRQNIDVHVGAGVAELLVEFDFHFFQLVSDTLQGRGIANGTEFGVACSARGQHTPLVLGATLQLGEFVLQLNATVINVLAPVLCASLPHLELVSTNHSGR